MLLGQDGNALVLLLVINIITFSVISFLKILHLLNDNTVAQFTRDVLPYFSVSAHAAELLTRPWTVFTYMFSGHNILTLISDMLWLWCFGYIMQDLAGNKKLIPVYLYGGFAGTLFFLLAVNLVPGLKAGLSSVPLLIGAGPAIMAVAIAATAFAPKYKIFPLINGGIPLWILTLIFVLISFASIGLSNPGYSIALVGGGVMGVVFVWQLKMGYDWSNWMVNLVSWADNLFNPEKKYVRKPEKPAIYYNAQKKPFVKKPHVTQQRIDELLDKINQKGYNLLTDEEKDFLKNASREEL